MTTRSEVEKQISELNEDALKDRMRIVLYGVNMVDGMDVGQESVAVMTRFVLNPEAGRSEQEQVRDLVMIALGPEGENKSKKIESDSDLLRKELEELEGVRNVKLTKYEAHVQKAVMFEWEEVLPSVIEVLKNFGLGLEFKKVGLKGVSGIGGNA